MLTPGDGLAVFAVCGTLIAAIIKFVKRSGNGNSKSNVVCPAHSGIVANMENTDRRLTAIETDTKEILKYVKMK